MYAGGCHCGQTAADSDMLTIESLYSVAVKWKSVQISGKNAKFHTLAQFFTEIKMW